MNKYFLPTLLLLFGNYYTPAKAKNLDLPPDARAYLPPLIHKNNNSYLPPANTHHHLHQEKLVLKNQGNITNQKPNYIHNQPKVIDDPLPLLVDSVEPLDIDFKKEKRQPLIKGAVVRGLLFKVYAKPLFREKPTDGLSASHVITHEDEDRENHNLATQFQSSDHNIKAESSIASKTYVKNPEDLDVVSINSFNDHGKKFKLFNHDDDDIGLTGSIPVVIFKAGDDIEFLKDTSVIDDYEHKFSEEEEPNKTKKS